MAEPPYPGLPRKFGDSALTSVYVYEACRPSPVPEPAVRRRAVVYAARKIATRRQWHAAHTCALLVTRPPANAAAPVPPVTAVSRRRR